MPPQRRRQRYPAQRFRISAGSTPAQRWALSLPSPDCFEVPPWYSKALKKAETRAQSSVPPPSGRYLLRPRRVQPIEQPLKAQSPQNKTKRKNKNLKTQSSRAFPSPRPVHRTTRYNLRSAPQPPRVDPVLNSEYPIPTSGSKMPPRKRPRIDPTDISESPVFSDEVATLRPRQQGSTIGVGSIMTRQTTTHVERRTGTQRLIQLRYQVQPKFIYLHSLEDCPHSVQELCVRLKQAACHYEGVIPRQLQSLILREYPFDHGALPNGVWSTSSLTSNKEREVKNLYDRVKDLYHAMIQKNGIGSGTEEAAWYGVIEQALGQFTSQLREEEALNFRNLAPVICTTSAIPNDLLPSIPMTKQHVKSAKIDLLIGYPQPQEPWEDLLEKRDSVERVALTPLLGLEYTFFGVIPVEVKNATGDSIDARYQLALCASGMLQLRQTWRAGGSFDSQNPPIIIALSIVGHIWSYYVIFLSLGLGNPDPHNPTPQNKVDFIPRIVLGPFMAGHTMGLLPTFQLFHFLTVLREWVVKEWAPAVYAELKVPAAGGSAPTAGKTRHPAPRKSTRAAAKSRGTAQSNL